MGIEKVSETVVKITETETRVSNISLKQLREKLKKVDSDIAVLDKQRLNLLSYKAALVDYVAQAEALGVKDQVTAVPAEIVTDANVEAKP